MPDSAKVVEVLACSKEFLEDPANKHHKDIFVWYFNEYLLSVLGKTKWNKESRMSLYPTSMVKHQGKDRILLTESVEAFGLVMLDNCHEKWANIYKLKEQNGDSAEIPRGNKPDAELYQAKYSDAFNGQKKNGGWSVAGIERYSDLMKEVENLRKDKDSLAKMYGYMQEIMVKMHAPPPPKPSTSGDDSSSSGNSTKETAKQRKARLAQEALDRANKKRKISRKKE